MTARDQPAALPRPAGREARWTIELVEAVGIGSLVILERDAGERLEAIAWRLGITPSRALWLARVARCDEAGHLMGDGTGRLTLDKALWLARGQPAWDGDRPPGVVLARSARGGAAVLGSNIDVEG